MSSAESSPVPSAESKEVHESGPAGEGKGPLLDDGVFKPDKRFWLIMASLMTSVFLAALDLTVVAIALPAIADDLGGANYLWVGNAYTLTSTALIPTAGALASILGRRPVMMGALAFFLVGSILCAAAPTMPVLIAARALQGIGGGGIMTMTQVVMVDLVPLAQRGKFFGLIGAVFAVATTIGPVISGALTSAGQWRVIFWLNLPFCVAALALVFIFLNVKAPQGTLSEKLKKFDLWNLLFIAATSSVVLAFSWAGSTHPWSSYQTLVPLILGIVGIVLFLWIERKVEFPTIPTAVVNNRTSVLALIAILLHSTIMMALAFYLPTTLFQAAQGSSAVISGVKGLPISFSVAPAAIAVGVIVTRIKKYKGVNIAGWVLLLIGTGTLSTIRVSTPTVAWVFILIVPSLGLGVLQTGVIFPTLAPLHPSEQPQAQAFSAFVRSFGQILGIALGGTILQNILAKELPPSFVDQFGDVSELAFAAIPVIKTLPVELAQEVREAFMKAFQAIAFFMLGMSAVGFVSALFLREIAMSKETDKNWGLKERPAKEAAASVV